MRLPVNHSLKDGFSKGKKSSLQRANNLMTTRGVPNMCGAIQDYIYIALNRIDSDRLKSWFFKQYSQLSP